MNLSLIGENRPFPIFKSAQREEKSNKHDTKTGVSFMKTFRNINEHIVLVE